jgi:hypothetical protein
MRNFCVMQAHFSGERSKGNCSSYDLLHQKGWWEIKGSPIPEIFSFSFSFKLFSMSRCYILGYCILSSSNHISHSETRSLMVLGVPSM